LGRITTLSLQIFTAFKKWHNLNLDYQINFITDEHSSSIQLLGINTIHWKQCFDLRDVRQKFLLKEAERALQEKDGFSAYHCQ
ncbi:TPA: hypothetical protein ACF2PS_002987, partial [Legionella pneumophila]